MYDGTLRPDDLSRIAEERDLLLSTERCGLR